MEMSSVPAFWFCEAIDEKIVINESASSETGEDQPDGTNGLSTGVIKSKLIRS